LTKTYQTTEGVRAHTRSTFHRPSKNVPPKVGLHLKDGGFHGSVQKCVTHQCATLQEHSQVIRRDFFGGLKIEALISEHGTNLPKKLLTTLFGMEILLDGIPHEGICCLGNMIRPYSFVAFFKS
jgi:hypothetical protein